MPSSFIKLSCFKKLKSITLIASKEKYKMSNAEVFLILQNVDNLINLALPSVCMDCYNSINDK